MVADATSDSLVAPKVAAGHVRLSVCVQHHPARAHLLPALLRRLPRDTEIVTDPDPDSPFRSPLRTYWRALDTTPAWATHRVVVQDDAMPGARFASRALAAIRERPDDVVALFTPGSGVHGRRVRHATGRGDRWVQLTPQWVPVVATSWPVPLLTQYLEWLTRSGYDPWTKHRGDDGPPGRWAIRNRVPVWAVVPSIVQHPDLEPSLIGRVAGGGRNRARVAAAFEG